MVAFRVVRPAGECVWRSRGPWGSPPRAPAAEIQLFLRANSFMNSVRAVTPSIGKAL